MNTYELINGAPPVSRVGIGGHYQAMEEGIFERGLFISYAIRDFLFPKAL